MSNKRKKSTTDARSNLRKPVAGFHPEAWHLRIVIGLCVIGFLIYLNSFTGSFHFDDLAVIVNNPAIRNVWDFGALLNAFNTRVIPGWTFAVNFALGQLNVVGYHFFNIWLHVCNAVLVYTLAYQLLGLDKNDKSENKSRHVWIAFVAALIFLTHPVQTQAVNYIWQRTTLCATFFYLGTIVLYLHARVSSSRRYYLAALSCCLLAMLSKEIAFTLPLMIVLIEAMFLRRVASQKRDLFWAAPFLMMLLVIPLMLQRSDALTLKIMRPHSITQGVADEVVSRKEYVLTQINVTRSYLQMFFWPVNQSIDHDYPLVSQSGWAGWVGSLVFLLGIVSAGFFCLKSCPMGSLGIFWLFMTLSVEALVTSSDVFVEHRLYLPMVGLSMVTAFLFERWFFPKNIKLASVVIVVVVLILCAMTFARNGVWKNDLTLWDDAIEKYPFKARPYNNRGVVFKSINSFDLALRDFNRALSLDPDFSQAYYNRGGVYRSKGEYDLAINDYENVLRLEPENAQAYDAIGSIYRRQDKFDDALKYFNESIRLNPTDPEVYSSRAYIHQKLGKDELAIADYSRAVEADPQYVYAYNNRGNFYLKMGNLKSAIEDYSRAVNIQPRFAEAYLNRSVASFYLGLINESKLDMDTAQMLGAVPKEEFIKRLNHALESKNNQNLP